MYLLSSVACLYRSLRDGHLLFFITCETKLLNVDWLRKRAFLLNHEGTFGNQEGIIIT